MTSLTRTPAWKALAAHASETASVHLRELFATDPGRFERFSIRLGDLLFDYSKNRITADTHALLIDLARQAKLGEEIGHPRENLIRRLYHSLLVEIG